MFALFEAVARNTAVRLGADDISRPQIVSSSYGNDSVATVQWVKEHGFKDVHVVFIDTGWSSETWPARVDRCEGWVRSIGYVPHRIVPPIQFEELILSRGGFPNQQYQWCSGHLKGVPFLEWVDEFDRSATATVVIGKRREESRERVDTQEWIFDSEYHGGRTVRHPLYAHTEAMRDELLRRAGFEPLPHRSQECAPCVNANRGDMLLLGEREISRVECLEFDVDKTMFRPKRHMGAKGIRQVIKWANSPKGKYGKDDSPALTCASGYCGF